MKVLTSCLLSLLLITVSCNTASKKKEAPDKPKTVVTKPLGIKIIMLPLGKVTPAFISRAYAAVKLIVPGVELAQKESMPQAAFYAPRNRYRADSLINWMSRRASQNQVYVGITMQDISTTKNENPDSGVMGLGFNPGNACVASDFRLRNKNYFYKVVLHELGHTAGLPHCPEQTCFMVDAEGKDKSGGETGFCDTCKNYLINKGWKL